MRVVFTPQGRQALVNAQNNGTNAVLVTEIGVTEQAFTAGEAATLQTLPGELKRLTTFGGSAVAADVIHVSIRDDTPDTYTLRGIGLYLADGTLLCAYGQRVPILQKSPQAMMMLAADMTLADIDAALITFGSTEFLNPPATTEVQGVVELATNDEAIQGKDARRALTPANLLAVINDRFGIGAPTKLAKDLLAAATAVVARGLLELKSAALKDEGEGNGLDADMLDGEHGPHYLDYRNFTNVPRSFYLPGQVVLMANKAAPTGMLLCNGAAVSRVEYAALFDAIGTVYGAGDGSTTFNVPNVEAGTAPVHTNAADSVGVTTKGATIAHSHGVIESAAGDHSHAASTGNAGSHAHTAEALGAGAHAHGASSSGVGDHAHGAWTDEQGWHGHTGSTSASGDHTHSTTRGVAATNSSTAGSGFDNLRYDGSTGAAGNHAHTFSTDGAGTHAHNIGMNGAGAHSHTISIADAPNHTHPVSVGAAGGHEHTVSVAAAGDHTHGVTVNPFGGQANYPAGIYMRYFIAY